RPAHGDHAREAPRAFGAPNRPRAGRKAGRAERHARSDPRSCRRKCEDSRCDLRKPSSPPEKKGFAEAGFGQEDERSWAAHAESSAEDREERAEEKEAIKHRLVC